jgi:hypothetical protein
MSLSFLSLMQPTTLGDEGGEGGAEGSGAAGGEDSGDAEAPLLSLQQTPSDAGRGALRRRAGAGEDGQEDAPAAGDEGDAAAATAATAAAAAATALVDGSA